ncbi:MAG TPA: hypothetical protein VGQ59_00900, partial [Cyclobacteriaceae bacterium]|nr:hypothetical protein [Cyclobacteriaceae bacterium]
MKFIILTAGLLLFKIIVSGAQTSSITDFCSDKNIFFVASKEGLVGIYKKNTSSDTISIFRRIVFDEKLEVSSSREIRIDGNAKLLSRVTTDSFLFYAFYSLANGKESINFILTDKNGMKLNSFAMSPADFEGIFEKTVRKIKNLRLDLLVPEINNDGIVIVYPSIAEETTTVGRLFSMNIYSGEINWKLMEPLSVTQMIITEERLIVHSEKKLFLDKYSENFILFFDLKDGSLISAPYLGDKELKRTIGIFTLVGKNLLIIGNEFKIPITQTSLFTRAYDLNGNLWLEKVESKPDKKGLRFKGLLAVYDENGDVLIFGESFRKAKVEKLGYSPTDFVGINVNLVGGAGFGATNIVGYLPMPNQSRNAIITENLKVMKINPSTMAVTDAYSFQSDRRVGFTEFHSFGPDILMKVNNKIWFYNINDPSVPPKFLTNFKESNELILTAY